MTAQVPQTDLRHLRRCVDLAAQAFDAGDEPFGSVLVSADRRQKIACITVRGTTWSYQAVSRPETAAWMVAGSIPINRDRQPGGGHHGRSPQQTGRPGQGDQQER